MTTTLGFLTMAARMGMADAGEALKQYKAERAELKRWRGCSHWVATYGDGGLDVTFYGSESAYDRAMNEAEREHARDELDSYTGGETLPPLPYKPTLYLRREPSTDPALLDARKAAESGARANGWPLPKWPQRFDVVAYRAKIEPGEAVHPSNPPVARWLYSHEKSKPRRGCKSVMLNCMRYRVEWMADVVEVSQGSPK